MFVLENGVSGFVCLRQLTNAIATRKPNTQLTVYMIMHTYINIETCNTLHRYKPRHSQHSPSHDLGGPLLPMRVHCTVIMIGGNEYVVVTAMTGLTKFDGNATAKHTTNYIYNHSQMHTVMHTWAYIHNVLYGYKPRHSQHAPLHDLGGPRLFAPENCAAIMICGNKS